MSSSRPNASGLELIGVSHKSASLEVLSRFALSKSEIENLYKEAAAVANAEDLVVVSTCNRTELYAFATHAQDLSAVLLQRLRTTVGPERMPAGAAFYRYQGEAAFLHLCEVACGLDSMIVGEAEILGQVKSAYEESLRYAPHSAYFARIFQSAIKTGKRSRGETDIGHGAVSVASAAVHLATRIYSDLHHCTVVIVGAGDTGRLVAEHFAGQKPKELIVVNRTLARGQSVAASVNGVARGWEELTPSLAAADIVVCTVSADAAIVSKAMVAQAMSSRLGSTLAILDLGLPRNVDPGVNQLENVFVHDLEALKQVVDTNLALRNKEAEKVKAIIENEMTHLSEWRAHAQVGPLIAALRESVERMRQNELDKACKTLGAAERDAVDQATRAIVNKILHGPLVSIKQLGDSSEERLNLVREIFASLGPQEPRS